MKGSIVVDIIENFSIPSVVLNEWTSWKQPNEWNETSPAYNMDTYMA